MAASTTVPAFPPPTGHISNFVDPVNHAHVIIACSTILLVIGVLTVAARVVSRTVLTDWRLGWDDCASPVGLCIQGMFIGVMESRLTVWPQGR